MGERSIAPSPGRIRAARAQGIRAGTRSLLLGAGVLSLVAVGPALVRAMATAFGALGGGTEQDLAAVFSGALLPALGLFPAVMASLWLAISVATGHLQPRREGSLVALARRLRGRGGEGVDVAPPLALLGAAIALLAVVTLGGLAVAPAVRAADASGPALATLWQNWAVRASLFLGTTCVLLGVAQHVLARRRIFRALHVSPDEARTVSRGSGAG